MPQRREPHAAAAVILKNQSIILDRIYRLAHDGHHTVVFTTHHPHHAFAVADTALLMFDVAEYACGPTPEVLNEPNLRRLYGVPLRWTTVEHEGRSVRTLVPIFDPGEC